MRVIRSTSAIGISTFFNRMSDAKEEALCFLENACIGDSMTYEIIEMSKEDYDALPEVERG